MPKRTGDFDEWLLRELTDPQIAASYVNAAIATDPNLLPEVLGEVARAHSMKKVAKEAGVARESLYTGLSEAGNPTIGSLNGVLSAVGLAIRVAPLGKAVGGQTRKKRKGKLVLKQPLLLNKDVLGDTANVGAGLRLSDNFIAAGQSNCGRAFSSGGKAAVRFGTVQRELAKERGARNQWNPMNVANQRTQSFKEFLTRGSTKLTPTTYSLNQLLGT